MKANWENIRFSSALINANFESRGEIFNISKNYIHFFWITYTIRDTERFDRYQ